ILMNISGGVNLSLYEVQEAADLVTSAADTEVNVIFGNVINENLKEEVIVTVIATGFDEKKGKQPPKQTRRPIINDTQEKKQPVENKTADEDSDANVITEPVHDEDVLDIPTFLRNRNRNR